MSEVDHDRLGRKLAGLDRAIDGLPRGRLEVSRLDADDDVRIFFHHGGTGGGVHLGDVVFNLLSVHARAHDIQPGKDPRLGVIDSAGFEGFEVAMSGAARVHGRGDAVWQRVVIGLKIQIGAAGVEVRVDVDQAGRDIIIAHVEHESGMRRRQILRDPDDFIFHQGNIESAVAFVPEVEHVAVFEQHVVNGWRLGQRRCAKGHSQKTASGDHWDILATHALKYIL